MHASLQALMVAMTNRLCVVPALSCRPEECRGYARACDQRQAQVGVESLGLQAIPESEGTVPAFVEPLAPRQPGYQGWHASAGSRAAQAGAHTW